MCARWFLPPVPPRSTRRGPVRLCSSSAFPRSFLWRSAERSQSAARRGETESADAHVHCSSSGSGLPSLCHKSCVELLQPWFPVSTIQPAHDLDQRGAGKSLPMAFEWNYAPPPPPPTPAVIRQLGKSNEC